MKTSSGDGFEFNSELLERWIKRKGRGGKERLAVAAELSAGMIDRLRRTRRLPSGTSMVKLSVALGVPISELIIHKRQESRSA